MTVEKVKPGWVPTHVIALSEDMLARHLAHKLYCLFIALLLDALVLSSSNVFIPILSYLLDLRNIQNFSG